MAVCQFQYGYAFLPAFFYPTDKSFRFEKIQRRGRSVVIERDGAYLHIFLVDAVIAGEFDQIMYE